MGDKGKAQFWEDTWLGDEKLCVTHERIFRNSKQKYKLIKNVCGWDVNERWYWNLSWRQRWFIWE